LKLLPLRYRQWRKGPLENLEQDHLTGIPLLCTVRRQSVHHRPPFPGLANYKPLSNQPCGECAECLIRVEGQLRQGVGRRTGIAADLAKSVPLHEAHTQWAEPAVQRSVMLGLHSFDRERDFFQLF
jgi:hypothetical protein